MTARLALACAALLLSPVALAQSAVVVDRARGLPVGLAVPGTVAGADEPTALAVNPAGLGFVDGPVLQYAFEGGRGGFSGNGLYLATPLGPLVPGLSFEWVSPAGSPRYLRTNLALALGFGQVLSLGYAWSFYASPDPAWDSLFSMDAGLTWRPFRFLSLGASALGLEARLAGRSLPVRYVFGGALRHRDGLAQLGVDLVSDDEGRGGFAARSLAATLSVGLEVGLTLQAQALFPVREAQGPLGATVYQVALGLQQPHVGVVASAAGAGGRSWPSSDLVGLRLSASRYGHSLLRHIQVLDLEHELERPSPLAILLGAEPDPYGALLQRLREIRDDPSVSALVVQIGELPLGEGRTEELRAALASVRAKKPVHALLVRGGTREYWLATAAGQVYAPPASVVSLTGIAATRFFLREGLGKLGVSFEAVVVGRYKSAPEALTRSAPSEAEREMVTSLLDDRFGRLVRGVAEARRLPEARVRELVDQGIFTAEEARAAGLVDATLWPDQVEERVRASGAGGRLGGRLDGRRRAAQRWGPRPAVAVIRLEGAIAPGRSRLDPLAGGAVAGAQSVVRALRAAAGDGSVKAIVLRLESPGGDGFASAEIWRAVREARRRKPVVASMGDVAASGAYLVASGADLVVAEPSTLTGSIGVFALKADLSGLLAKLGVALASDQRGRRARIDSAVKPWTPDERSALERQLGWFYQQFVDAVAEGRALPRHSVETAAQGRVFTGAQALERRLVDRLGSLADAVALAEQRAGLDRADGAEVRRIDPPDGFGDQILAGLESLAGAGQPLRALAAKLPELRAASLLSEMGPVLALPSEWLGAADDR